MAGNLLCSSSESNTGQGKAGLEFPGLARERCPHQSLPHIPLYLSHCEIGLGGTLSSLVENIHVNKIKQGYVLCYQQGIYKEVIVQLTVCQSHKRARGGVRV